MNVVVEPKLVVSRRTETAQFAGEECSSSRVVRSPDKDYRAAVGGCWAIKGDRWARKGDQS